MKRQNFIFRHLLISLHDSMAPVRRKIGPNQMRSGHQGLVKTDTDTTCWRKCRNFIFRHIFIDLDDFMESIR